MKNNLIRTIADLLTEDPDIFCEAIPPQDAGAGSLEKQGRDEWVGSYKTSGGKRYEVWIRAVSETKCRITYLRAGKSGKGTFSELVRKVASDIRALGFTDVDWSSAKDDEHGGASRDRLFAKYARSVKESVYLEGMAGNMDQSGSAGQGNVVNAAKPLNATEIGNQADKEVGTDTDASNAVADRMKMQQEIERKQAEERKKIIEPQMEKLNQAIQQLNTGVLQGKKAVTTGSEQIAGLEKELTGVNSLLGNLQKQI